MPTPSKKATSKTKASQALSPHDKEQNSSNQADLSNFIQVRGAREHNLKNVDVESVQTSVSGKLKI